MKRSFFLSAACEAFTAATQTGSFFDVTTDNSLVSFDTAAPTTFITSRAIKDLKASDGLTNDAGAGLLNLTHHAKSVPPSSHGLLIVYSLFGH